MPIIPAKESVKGMSAKIRISKTKDARANVIIDILITIRSVLQNRQFGRLRLYFLYLLGGIIFSSLGGYSKGFCV